MSEHGLDNLLTVGEAIRIIDSVPVVSRHATKRADRPSDLALQADVLADRDYPPFDKALMDGFAVRSSDVSAVPSELSLTGEVAAGGSAAIRIGPGECVAIMTGAEVPSDADAVLPVEVSETAGTRVRFNKAAKPGDAISRRGADLKQGSLVLAKGATIGPAQVGALVQVGAAGLIPASLYGCESDLRGHVLVTGDEIVGENDGPGLTEMRDVNGPMLTALLASLGVRCGRSRVVDDLQQTREAIDRLARDNDVLCVTGGMSMGKYDYVPRVLIELGFELKITKLRIKPGKPFVFATRKRAEKTDFVFGLPGNPVSGFCCSVRLVSRLVARMQGREPTEPILLELESALLANGPREFYQPAIVSGARVKPLGWKGSADVFTLAKANALIVRPLHDGPKQAGERVEVIRWQ